MNIRQVTLQFAESSFIFQHPPVLYCAENFARGTNSFEIVIFGDHSAIFSENLQFPTLCNLSSTHLFKRPTNLMNPLTKGVTKAIHDEAEN